MSIAKGDKLVVVDVSGLSAADRLSLGQTVTALQNYSGPGTLVNVQREDGTSNGFYARRFKVVQPKEQEMKQEFKAGDKVRVTCNSGNNFKVGDIVTFVRKSPYSENSILEGVINTRHDSRYGKVDTQSLRPGQFEATFSLDKPLFTAEGTPVVLVTKTNPRDPKFPVLVYEGKAGVPTKYDLNGKAKNGVARRNLTNAVPKVEAPVTEKFVALLDPKTNPNGQQVAISLYDTAQKAREACAVNALRVGGKGPVGIAKVVLVSGRWPV